MGTRPHTRAVRHGSAAAIVLALLATLSALAFVGTADAAKSSKKSIAPSAAQVKKCQAVVRKSSKASVAKKRACRVVLKKAARATRSARATGISARVAPTALTSDVAAVAAPPQPGSDGGPAVAAVPADYCKTTAPSQTALPGSTFEIDLDANLATDGTAVCKDWDSFATLMNAPNPVFPSGVFATKRIDLPSATDDIYSGGAQEDDEPATITQPSPVGQPKTDLKRYYLASESVNNVPFLYLGWARGTSGGTTAIEFELNRAEDGFWANGLPKRAVGDRLITYRFQGVSDVPQISLRRWVADTSANNECSVNASDNGSGFCWSPPAALNSLDLNVTSTSALAKNDAGLPAAFDTVENTQLTDTGLFGEVALNLQASGITPTNSCAGFGSVYARSISGLAFGSSLADIVRPVPITVGNCRIEVKKTTVPASGVGKFNLLVNGAVRASDVGDGGTTGEVAVSGSSATVGEAGGTGTSLGDYTSTYQCRAANGAGSVVASGTGTSATVNGITAGADIVCTFTNTKRGQVVIDKVTDPSGDAQLFGFTGTDLPGTANDTF
jgi:hypothetical protein